MTQANQDIKSIAVITGLDLVGDALIKLPFARAIRAAWPHAKVHWVTSKDKTTFSGILREPTRHLIDEIHETPAWLATTEKAANGDAPAFDLILDTRNRWKEALHARKVPHKIFIGMALRHLFSDRHPSLFTRKPAHLCDRLLQMVELAAGYLPPSTGALPVPLNLMRIAEKILPNGPTYIGLAPGCSTPYRMWPREKFMELAKMQSSHDRVPVFILGPQEVTDHAMLAAAVPEALFPLQDKATWGTDKMTLDHTLAIATRLTVGVANDSGPGHIMAAVDCPIVSLFGPTTPLKAAPRATHVIAVRAQEFGSDQMDAIPVKAVSHAIDQMMEQLT